MANELGDRKINNIVATGADEVVTANPGCHLQLRATLDRNGKSIQVRHIVELLDEAYGGESTARPGQWAVDRI